MFHLKRVPALLALTALVAGPLVLTEVLAATPGPTDCTSVQCGAAAWMQACGSKPGVAAWCSPVGGSPSGDAQLHAAASPASRRSFSPLTSSSAMVNDLPPKLTMQPAGTAHSRSTHRGTIGPLVSGPVAPQPVRRAGARPSAASATDPTTGLAKKTGWTTVDGRSLEVRAAVPGKPVANSETNHALTPRFSAMGQMNAFDDRTAMGARRQQVSKLQSAIELLPSLHPGFEMPTDLANMTPPKLLPIHSCDEYVYKKYFQYSAFQDVTKVLGMDTRAVFDAAMNPSSPVRITRRLVSYGPDAGAQIIDRSTYGGQPQKIDFSFDTYDATQDIYNWNSFYQVDPTTKQVTSISAFGPTFWGGVQQPFAGKCGANAAGTVQAAHCWWDLANALEAAHRAYSDEELSAAAARSDHFADLINIAQQSVLAEAANYCRSAQAWGDHVAHPYAMWGSGMCIDPGKPLGTHVIGPSGPGQTSHVVPTPGPTAQGAAGAGYKQVTIPAAVSKGFGAAAWAQVAAAYTAESAMPAGQSCTNPNELANPCTWSYARFAGLLDYWEKDLLWLASTSNVGQPLPSMAGPTFDLAQCRHYLPNFNLVWDTPHNAKYAGNHLIFAEIYPAEKLWFSAYAPTTKDAAGMPSLGPAYAPGFWASDWKHLTGLFKEYDSGAAGWAKFKADQEKYYGAVNGVVAAANDLPTLSPGTVGEQTGDGFDQGNPSLFGASAHYALGWQMSSRQSIGPYPDNKRTNSPLPSADRSCNGMPCGDEKMTCRMNGAMNASADADVQIFGSSISLLDTAFHSSASDDSAQNGNQGAHMDAHFSLLGDEMLPANVKAGINQSSYGAGGFNISAPVVSYSTQEPDPPISVPFAAGPIPMDLEAGANISAGVNLITTGKIDSTSCSQTLPTVYTPASLSTPGFELSSSVEPWIRVDGFVQVGVDLVFVKVGVGVDLEVIKIDLKPTVGIQTAMANGRSVANFGTTMDLGFEALSGYAYLYIEIWYVFGTADFQQKLFSWDGFHGDKTLFSFVKPYDMEAINYRLNYPQFPKNALASEEQFVKDHVHE